MGVYVTSTVNGSAQVDQIVTGHLHGLNLAGERLLSLSAVEVPFELGNLSDSGATVPAETLEEGVAVVYDTPYAARLHEHPEFNFQNGRKGKYLEDPAMQNREELGQIVAKAGTNG